MRRLIIFSFLIVVLITSCDDDDVERIYIGSGTIKDTEMLNLDFQIKFDDGDLLNPVINYDDNSVEDGDRVLVRYSFIDGDIESNNIKVFDIDDILTKDILQLTEQNKDSIGDDKIHIKNNDIWLSEKHLNVIFDYYGYDETHYINLVKPLGDTHDNEGRLILEFKHNANDDAALYLLRGIVSFNLESLRVSDEESVDFVVRANTYGDNNFEWEGSYVFESNNPALLQNKQHLNLSGEISTDIK